MLGPDFTAATRLLQLHAKYEWVHVNDSFELQHFFASTFFDKTNLSLSHALIHFARISSKKMLVGSDSKVDKIKPISIKQNVYNL